MSRLTALREAGKALDIQWPGFYPWQTQNLVLLPGLWSAQPSVDREKPINIFNYKLIWSARPSEDREKPTDIFNYKLIWSARPSEDRDKATDIFNYKLIWSARPSEDREKPTDIFNYKLIWPAQSSEDRDKATDIFNYKLIWGTRWRSWLNDCATNRKVAGSNPDGVNGIFHRHNPSDRTVALGSTQPLTDMRKVKQSRYRSGVAQRVPGS